MSKPKPVRLAGDDCMIHVGGEVYSPHEGEWVEVIAVLSSDELAILADVAMLETDARAAEDDSVAGGELGLRLAGLIPRLRDAVCWRIVRWNWTDLRGAPLPVPDGTSGPLARLSLEELVWLLKTGTESAGERKKDSLGSPTISSAMALPPMAANGPTTAPSRLKARSR